MTPPPPVPSSINRKSFQPSVALYLYMVPTGTYSVALRNVFKLNVLRFDDLPVISNGSSIRETTVIISAPPKAPLPMLVTLLPIVTEVRLQ